MEKIRTYHTSFREYVANAGSSPRHDWTILLFMFLILIVVVFIISGIVFAKFSMDSVSEEAVAQSGSVLTGREDILDVLSSFEARAAAGGPSESILVDPSR